MPRPIPLSLFAAVLACAPAGGTRTATAPVRSGATARVALAQPLPAMDGAHLEVTIVEVRYGPGESSSPHRHPCAVTGYVVEGAFRSQSGTEPERCTRPVRASTRLPTRCTGCRRTQAPRCR